MNRFKKYSSYFIIFLLIGFYQSSSAQVLNEKQIDRLVTEVMEAFKVPGIALAVIKDNKTVYLKGHGQRSIDTKEPVDENTAFAIASNSKVFTAVALGMLVDSGKLNWNSKVTDIIPEFKLYDNYVTGEFTVTDLLTHRSGLGLGAGDLMFWPDSANFSTKEVIHNLRFLKPVSSFRTKFDYDNLLYVVAGEVINRVSGSSWEDFIEDNIFKKIGMHHSSASFDRLKNKTNVIDAHTVFDGKLKTLSRFLSQTTNPAGGINSSITDMAKWVQAILNKGKFGSDLTRELFSEKVLKEVYTPQTIIRGNAGYNAHFMAYGLGLFLSDQNGYFVAEHTGGLAGMVSQVTIIPELGLGIVVLTNQESGAAFTAITNTIKDGYFGIRGKDRVKEMLEIENSVDEQGTKVADAVYKAIENQKLPTNVDAYIGRFRDNWFGDIQITKQADHLYFKSARSPKLQGKMYYYKGNTFVVKWNDRTMIADAYVNYVLDTEGIGQQIKMKAISPLTDFSFDFHDLDLKRL